MKVTDLNGCELEVTDLEKAIAQTENFKDLHHTPPVESDKQRQKYWQDLYQKLLKIQSELKNT